jgi:hypothetical protein
LVSFLPGGKWQHGYLILGCEHVPVCCPPLKQKTGDVFGFLENNVMRNPEITLNRKMVALAYTIVMVYIAYQSLTLFHDAV